MFYERWCFFGGVGVVYIGGERWGEWVAGGRGLRVYEGKGQKTLDFVV